MLILQHFSPPWTNNNKNLTVSQCLTYTLLKHLISDPLNILLSAKTCLICYCQRHLEQMSTRRMLSPRDGCETIPKDPRKYIKTDICCSSNWGTSYDCTTTKTGVKIWFLYLIGMLPTLQLFPPELPLAKEALGSIKSFFQGHTRAQTGADFGALKRSQYWALEKSLT